MPISELALLQRQHAICIAKLILYIQSEGYSCSISEGYVKDTVEFVAKIFKRLGLQVPLRLSPHRSDGGHFKRIAIDINIFKGEEWLKTGNEPIWRRVGKFWCSLHPLARWNPDDPNHFGFLHNGVS